MAATTESAICNLVKWTAEIESILISEIRAKPQLWDVKSPLYKVRTLKRSSYQEISEKMKVLFPEHDVLFTDKKINIKFGNLKTIYSRNLRKLKILKSGDGCEGFSSSWVHYTQMAFLSDCIAATPSSSNLDALDSIPNSQEILSVLEDDSVDIDMQLQEESQLILDVSDVFSQSLNYVRESATNEAASVASNSSLAAADIPGERCVPDPVTHTPNVSKMPMFSKTPTSQKRKRPPPPEKELLTTACKTLKSIGNTSETAQDALGHYIALKLKTISDDSKRNRAEADLLQTLQKYLN